MNGNKNNLKRSEQQPDRQAGKSSGGIMDIMLRRRWQLIGCLVIVNALALASLYYSTPRFEAVSQIQIVSNEAQGSGYSKIPGMNNPQIRTQCEMFKSHIVLSETARRIGMAAKETTVDPAVLEKLRDQLRIRPLSGSNLINVIGVGETPEDAAKIANAAVEVYTSINKDSQDQENIRIAQKIEQQIASINEQIKEKEKQLTDFRMKNHKAYDQRFVTEARARILKLEDEIETGRMETLKLTDEAEDLRMALTGERQIIPTDELAEKIENDKTIHQLSEQLQTLRQEEKRLRQVYLPGHKLLSETRTRLADLEQMLQEKRLVYMQSTYHHLLERIEAIKEQEKVKQEMLDEQKRYSIDLTQKYQNYAKSVNELEALYRLKNDYDSRLQAYTLDKNMNEQRVELVDAAQVPTRPSGLNKEHRAAAILILGLILSIVFVTTADKLSESRQHADWPFAGFNTATEGQWPGWPIPYWMGPPAEAVSLAGTMEKAWAAKATSTLGRVGRIELGGANRDDNAFAARCRIVQTDQRCEQASAFRDIAARLLSRFGDTQQSVAMTSLGRQSGKTTCAVNLALLLAQSGRKVLLVDMNPQDAALYRVFRTDTDKPDVSATLADPRLLDEAIQSTDVMNLSVINSYNEDKWLHQTTTNAMIELDHKLARRFDWVIYDTGNLYSQLTCNLLQATGKAMFVVPLNDRQFAGQQTDIVEKIEHCGALSIGRIENIPLANVDTTTASTRSEHFAAR